MGNKQAAQNQAIQLNYFSSSFPVPISFEGKTKKTEFTAYNLHDIIVEDKSQIKKPANKNLVKVSQLFADKEHSALFSELAHWLNSINENELKAKLDLASPEELFALYQARYMAEQLKLPIAEKLKKAMD